MKLFYLLLSGCFLSLLFLSACKDNGVGPVIVDNTNNGFLTKEVAEVFAKNCATSGCHSGNTPSSGLSLENYSDLLKGSSDRSTWGNSKLWWRCGYPWQTRRITFISNVDWKCNSCYYSTCKCFT